MEYAGIDARTAASAATCSAFGAAAGTATEAMSFVDLRSWDEASGVCPLAAAAAGGAGFAELFFSLASSMSFSFCSSLLRLFHIRSPDAQLFFQNENEAMCAFQCALACCHLRVDCLGYLNRI